jgi:hypothetical protein
MPRIPARRGAPSGCAPQARWRCCPRYTGTMQCSRGVQSEVRLIDTWDWEAGANIGDKGPDRWTLKGSSRTAQGASPGNNRSCKD